MCSKFRETYTVTYIVGSSLVTSPSCECSKKNLHYWIVEEIDKQKTPLKLDMNILILFSFVRKRHELI